MASVPSTPGETPLAIPHQGMVEFVCLIEWLKNDGSAVAAGEAVARIETDKAVTTIDATTAGTLHILVPAGDAELPPGTVIGVLKAG